MSGIEHDPYILHPDHYTDWAKIWVWGWVGLSAGVNAVAKKSLSVLLLEIYQSVIHPAASHYIDWATPMYSLWSIWQKFQFDLNGDKNRYNFKADF